MPPLPVPYGERSSEGTAGYHSCSIKRPADFSPGSIGRSSSNASVPTGKGPVGRGSSKSERAAKAPAANTAEAMMTAATIRERFKRAPLSDDRKGGTFHVPPPSCYIRKADLTPHGSVRSSEG